MQVCEGKGTAEHPPKLTHGTVWHELRYKLLKGHITEKGALCPEGSCSSTWSNPAQNKIYSCWDLTTVREKHSTPSEHTEVLCNFTTARFQFMAGIVTKFCSHTDMLPLQPLFSFPIRLQPPPTPLSGERSVSTHPGPHGNSTTRQLADISSRISRACAPPSFSGSTVPPAGLPSSAPKAQHWKVWGEKPARMFAELDIG